MPPTTGKYQQLPSSTTMSVYQGRWKLGALHLLLDSRQRSQEVCRPDAVCQSVLHQHLWSKKAFLSSLVWSKDDIKDSNPKKQKDIIVASRYFFSVLLCFQHLVKAQERKALDGISSSFSWKSNFQACRVTSTKLVGYTHIPKNFQHTRMLFNVSPPLRDTRTI